MIDKSQFMRGTLEGCIVKIISKEETYGYEIVTRLQDFGFCDVKEGSTYPILVRLEKRKIISSIYKESPLGPKRKYYFLTDIGKEFLIEFEIAWNDVRKTVDSILKEDWIMFENEAIILKKENNEQSITLEQNDYDIIKDIMRSMSVFKVNSYDAEVIKRDLIGMAQELSLRDSNLKESIGDNITGFTNEIINNSSGPSLIEILLGLLGKISGLTFISFILLAFLAYRGLSWSIKPLILFFYITFYSISFFTEGIIVPLFSTKRGLIKNIPSIIGVSLFLSLTIITASLNKIQSTKMISAQYVIIISGLMYLISKYFYTKHIHELAKDKKNFIQDLI